MQSRSSSHAAAARGGSECLCACMYCLEAARTRHDCAVTGYKVERVKQGKRLRARRGQATERSSGSAAGKLRGPIHCRQPTNMESMWPSFTRNTQRTGKIGKRCKNTGEECVPLCSQHPFHPLIETTRQTTSSLIWTDELTAGAKRQTARETRRERTRRDNKRGKGERGTQFASFAKQIRAQTCSLSIWPLCRTGLVSLSVPQP